MSNKPMVGQSTPSFSVPAANGGEVSVGGAGRWQMAVVYRGKHCPFCANQLKELNGLLDEFKAANVDVVALSTDPQEKAESFAKDMAVNFPVGYDLSPEQALELGLYISTPLGDQENDRTFSEPGIFVTNPEGKLQIVNISNSPFSRPSLETVLAGIKYSQENGYPTRGLA